MPLQLTLYLLLPVLFILINLYEWSQNFAYNPVGLQAIKDIKFSECFDLEISHFSLNVIHFYCVLKSDSQVVKFDLSNAVPILVRLANLSLEGASHIVSNKVKIIILNTLAGKAFDCSPLTWGSLSYHMPLFCPIFASEFADHAALRKDLLKSFTHSGRSYRDHELQGTFLKVPDHQS